MLYSQKKASVSIYSLLLVHHHAMLFPRRSSGRLSFAARLLSTGLGAGLGVSLLSVLATPVRAQLPVCPPPSGQEYLLLVRGDTEADRNKIAATLPPANSVLICSYLDETLVRAGGFTSLETVNAWATYMTTQEGYESFVSRPSGSQVASTTGTQTVPQPGTSGTQRVVASNGLGYQPRRLASGYAVLVNYGSQPEIAATLGQFVRPVGLAVYRQQAYLLADYTDDAQVAAATLQRLNDAQLSAILVDAQQVVRLTTEVF